MILIPCLLLAIFAPGYLFPQMAARMSAPGRVGLKRKNGEQGVAEKPSQPGVLGTQQPTTSGDESAVGEQQAKENPVPAVEEAKGRDAS
jgi:hypothetical protein